MHLHPFQGFLAKNQRTDEPPRKFIIKSLRDHAPHGDPERLLCPVRAMRHYLRRTNEFRGKRKKLFLSLNPKHQEEISTNTISRWLREAIKLTYQFQAPSELEQLYFTSAHEVRAIAASLPVYRNVAIRDILKSVYWRNHNTFTDFYLRDMSLTSKTLGSKDGCLIIAAGQEISLNL